MPTPSDSALAPTPQSEVAARNAFTSCPPEDEREIYTVQDNGRSELTAYSTVEAEIEEEHATVEEEEQRQPAPDGDSSIAPTTLPDADTENESKLEHIEDVGASADESSPAVSHETDSLASRSPTPMLSSVEYLQFPAGRERTRPYTTSSFLRPGSRFRGTQKSDRQVYDVQVEIKDVDMAESFLCGYLRIQGLTDDHPTLTTFFEGEIIGPKHLFKTTNPTWGSTEKVDQQHWARFPAWRPLAKSAKSPNFTLKNFHQREHLFMRWKEYFLVPDHRVKTITGASFEGFYYICFSQCDGQVSGIYFHAKSEKYQQLELKHVEDHGCMAAMEFR